MATKKRSTKTQTTGKKTSKKKAASSGSSAARTPESAVSAAVNSRLVERPFVGDFIQDLIDFDDVSVVSAMKQSDELYLVSWST